MSILLRLEGITVAFAAPPKTGTVSITTIFGKFGWTREPYTLGPGKHVPIWSHDADYYLTAQREKEPWLRSCWQNIRTPIGVKPIDDMLLLKRGTFEAFRQDYDERYPRHYEYLCQLYGREGTATVIHAERLADDVADFLEVVHRRIIRAVPPQNVTP